MNNVQIEEEIEKLQNQISTTREKINELRAQRSMEEIKDYDFVDKSGKKVSLSDLFADKEELILIHNMGKSCVYCTLWADGFNSSLPHLENRMSFALSSPDEWNVMKEFAEKRNWNFKYVSYSGSSFAHDLGFAHDKDGRTWYSPGVSAMIKCNGKIYRVSKDYFGPGDTYSPIWHFIDLLPSANNPWSPKYHY